MSGAPTSAQHWSAKAVRSFLAQTEPSWGALGKRDALRFERKRLRPADFSLADWSSAQRRGAPRLYSATPTPFLTRSGLVAAMLGGHGAQRVPVLHDSGGGTTRRHWERSSILRRWQADAPAFGVTDHSSGSALVSRHVRWNLMRKHNWLSVDPAMRHFEVCGPVLSTRGHVTDAHIDDPDIWNSCHTGAKVWFLVDTSEWAAHVGVPFQEVVDDVFFDFDTFLALPGSRWALVQDGMAFFCPNRFTHHVVTLSRYAGVGTFVLTCDSAPRLHQYWRQHGTQWERMGVPGLVREAERRMQKTGLRVPDA